jgi:hypothetical protein
VQEYCCILVCTMAYLDLPVVYSLGYFQSRVIYELLGRLDAKRLKKSSLYYS